MRFWKIFVNRVNGVIFWIGGGAVDSQHGGMDGIDGWKGFMTFLEVDCHQLLEIGVALLMVDVVNVMWCRRCWAMLSGCVVMIRDGRVWTRDDVGKIVVVSSRCGECGDSGWCRDVIDEC